MEEKNKIERLGGFRLKIVILIGQGKHHVQEVGRIFQIRLWVNNGKATGLPICECGDRADLREEARGSNLEMAPTALMKQLLVEATGGIDHRRKDGHGMSIGRKALKVMLHRFIEQLIVR